MSGINLLPEDLRKKEKEKPFNDLKSKEVEFVIQSPQEQEVPQEESVVIDLKPQLEEKHVQKQKPVEEKERTEGHKLSIKRALNFDNLKHLFKKKKSEQKKEEEEVSVELLKEEIALQRSIKPELIKLGVLVVLLLILAFFIGFYFKSRQGLLKEQITDLESRLTNLTTQEAYITSTQDKLSVTTEFLKVVEILVRTRVNWNALFKEIEQRTLKAVYLTNLSVSNLNTIKISGRAKSAEDVTLQIKILQRSQEFANNVKLVSAQPVKEEFIVKEGDEERKVINSYVSFSFEFSVNPEWIKKNTL